MIFYSIYECYDAFKMLKKIKTNILNDLNKIKIFLKKFNFHSYMLYFLKIVLL